MKSKLIPSLLAGALLIGLAGTATAGTTSTTFNAGVTINQACEVAGTPVDFGSIGILADAANGVPGADNLQVTSTLSLNCTDTVPITVSVAGVSHYNVGFTAGTNGIYGMVNSTDSTSLLKYRVTQDSAGTIPWGDVTDNAALAMTATVGTSTVPMYFSILGSDNSSAPFNNPVKVGSYSDTATVTVAW
ncbi:MAG: hypothetical protein EPN69_14890 [Rhodanobacter sp.]|nr:MAG: hypothetical protein EPN69_14890 [Rhodanobacter sp.]TAM06812.1 MAG: hypothetical protein EPN71_00670 [Rhodanobacter sp.]TAM40035.1 MAG: hypothetical protein EPN58_11150 [Rhodanobacter sp.]